MRPKAVAMLLLLALSVATISASPLTSSTLISSKDVIPETAHTMYESESTEESQGAFHPFSHTPTFRISQFQLYNESAVHHLHTSGLWLKICVRNPSSHVERFVVRDTPFDDEKVSGDIDIAMTSGSKMMHIERVDKLGNSEAKDLEYTGPDVKRPPVDAATSQGKRPRRRCGSPGFAYAMSTLPCDYSQDLPPRTVLCFVTSVVQGLTLNQTKRDVLL